MSFFCFSFSWSFVAVFWQLSAFSAFPRGARRVTTGNCKTATSPRTRGSAMDAATEFVFSLVAAVAGRMQRWQAIRPIQFLWRVGHIDGSCVGRNQHPRCGCLRSLFLSVLSFLSVFVGGGAKWFVWCPLPSSVLPSRLARLFLLAFSCGCNLPVEGLGVSLVCRLSLFVSVLCCVVLYIAYNSW